MSPPASQFTYNNMNFGVSVDVGKFQPFQIGPAISEGTLASHTDPTARVIESR